MEYDAVAELKKMYALPRLKCCSATLPVPFVEILSSSLPFRYVNVSSDALE
jgi:hypothetical protein